MDKKTLQTKLEGLLRRKAELEKQLGITRAKEQSSTRSNDTKYRVSSVRAVQARAKKGEKAMLKAVNQMIQRTRNQLQSMQD